MTRRLLDFTSPTIQVYGSLQKLQARPFGSSPTLGMMLARFAMFQGTLKAKKWYL